jgi:hypothetical protein
VPAEPYASECGDAVENREGNESWYDNSDRKEDNTGKGADGKEERSFPRQGITTVTVLYERGDDRDMIPAEDNVNEDYSDQKASGHDGHNNSMVNKGDKGRDSKAETEMNELTDDLTHYGRVGIRLTKSLR